MFGATSCCAAWQVSCMLITFGIAFFGGQIVGLIAKLPFFLPPPQNDRKPNKPVLEFGNRCTG